MGHLITSSLLDGFAWLQSAPAAWKTKAQQEFIATIRRERIFNPTPEIIRGEQFERLVCDNCNVMSKDAFQDMCKATYSALLDEDQDVLDESKAEYLQRILKVTGIFYDRSRNAEQQVKVEGNISAFNEDFYLFGYADLVYPDLILDIKTTTKFKSNSKYTRRAQHLVYAYCTGIPKFHYIVADYCGTKYPLDYHCIAVDVDLAQAEQTLKGRIQNMGMYLRTHNLWQDYVTKFSKEHYEN